MSKAFVPYRPNIYEFTTAKSITSTNFFTPASTYEIASTTKIYQQGNHVYGNLVLHKKSGYIPISNSEIVGSIKAAYYPAHSLPLPSFLSNSEWSYVVLGYGFISNYTGTGDVHVKGTHDEDENKYSYVTIPLNYTY